MKKKSKMRFEIKAIPGKGKGVFAKQFIKAGKKIFHQDLSNLPKFKLSEIDNYLEQNSQLDGDHADYAGNGFFVIDMSPASYMNHCCDPNCAYNFHTISRKSVIALRDIQAGEELTHDYTACSIDQFNGNCSWELLCKCGSVNCRKIIKGDFLIMSAEWQKKYYKFLPATIRTKFKGKFKC